MLRNSLLSVLRNMGKHKLLSVINISGLSIGIATALAIALFITDELKYDKFHDRADSIYRIAMYAGEDFHNPLTPMPLAPLLTGAFPEVKKAVRVYKNRTNAKLI